MKKTLFILLALVLIGCAGCASPRTVYVFQIHTYDWVEMPPIVWLDKHDVRFSPKMDIACLHPNHYKMLMGFIAKQDRIFNWYDGIIHNLNGDSWTSHPPRWPQLDE